MYQRPTSHSELELRRRKINRRLNWVSLTIVVIAAVVGLIYLGERLEWPARLLTLAAVFAWVGFRLFRLRGTVKKDGEHAE